MRRKTAFTLIELLTVVLIIGILAMMGLGNLYSAQDRAKAAVLKENMHSCQIASEGYKTTTTLYADDVSKLDPFFPNGSFSVGGPAGNRGTNPFTNVQNDLIYTEVFTDTTAILQGRTSPPSAGPSSAGRVGYVMTTDGQSYAICGLGATGMRMASSTGGTMILSNQ